LTLAKRNLFYRVHGVAPLWGKRHPPMVSTTRWQADEIGQRFNKVSGILS
jgi:hypothetical protein